MIEVHLPGTIPVTVVVILDEDGHESSVHRVIAHDDMFEYHRNADGVLYRSVDTPDVTDEQMEAATKIAESEMWPGWEWGW